DSQILCPLLLLPYPANRMLYQGRGLFALSFLFSYFGL
ncbi:MAG TPA: hypothetical protein EYP28_03265, partial [Methanophagales archaeon]|nr:hypothetical protein [Methanophagales archaeon]